MATWFPLIIGTIDEGVARAAAGDPGQGQDESAASYGARFSPEERWLNWEEAAQALHQKCFALNIDVDGHVSARARIAALTTASWRWRRSPAAPACTTTAVRTSRSTG